MNINMKKKTLKFGKYEQVPVELKACWEKSYLLGWNKAQAGAVLQVVPAASKGDRTS